MVTARQLIVSLRLAWHSPNAMQELYMLGRCPKPQRGLRPLNTALHSAEIARLLAVFPSLTQCVKLQSQFELIIWGFTPTPLSGQSRSRTAKFN